MTNDLAGTGDTPYVAISQAMRAYFASVNADAGVCGRDLELAAEDDGYSPTRALEVTRTLVEVEGVLAMVGGLGTQAQKGVATYLNDPNADGDKADGVPDLFLSSAWSGWADTSQFPWTVGFIPDYFSDGVVLGRYVTQAFPGQRIGVIYADDDMGRDYWAGLQASVPDGALLSSYPFPVDAANLVDQVTRAKTDGAVMVLVAASPQMTEIAIREADAQDFAPRWLLSYTNAPSALARGLGGGTSAEQLLAGFAMLDGAVTTQYLLSPIEDEEAPALIEHQRIMQTFQGPPVSSLTVYGQSLAEVIVEAIGRTCDNLTREGLMAAAESINGFAPSLMWPGVEVHLSDSDHRAIQALQPVMIHADSTVTAEGDVISAEDVPAPSPASQ